MATAIKMHKYGNGDHETGVLYYACDEGGITLLFKDGYYYLYDDEKPGANHIKKMKSLAKQGRGLSTYINQHIRNNYKRKWRAGL